MEITVLIEKLKSFVEAGNKKSKIESDLGMPANCLASILTGKRDLGRKWVEPIQEYLSKKSGAAFDIDRINKQISKINELEPLELAKKQIAELKEYNQKLLEANTALEAENKALSQQVVNLLKRVSKNQYGNQQSQTETGLAPKSENRFLNAQRQKKCGI